ncbi:uncharacterized protein YydD (DUF2326 family) [Marinobacter persicus]|uniref:Uncharacterized protein YydD (DUF2326 family) n=1 Tax=Marinobacter persicus TaxID=930118 RepID=A0ABX5AQ84_9GAMM|nr:DUF2326 domain-containing protein [Marinobacter persicus]PPK53553.1 uncharacterized protein YydD (DUF2326 family) [Marinobacter persicus]PPK59940.1 uncharacterized protein YydD (DUF2326 family) [Marinobacter persicus]
MKLTKVYSNKNETFAPIFLEDGLNAVIAEIRRPENKEKDTHNLGKTTLAKLLDFLLLAQRSNKQFLFKHLSLFESFVFFLEIQITSDKFITVRRSVAKPSKISFKYHNEKHKDFTQLDDPQWDHADVTFDRARNILNSALDLRDLSPWGYRQITGYLLRAQNDYTDVFQLQKFRGKHETWKPFLAHILGFESSFISEQYETEKRVDDSEKSLETVKTELGGLNLDSGKIEGLLQLKLRESEKKESLLSQFDFREEDAKLAEVTISDCDRELADLTTRRYYLNQSKSKIEESIKDNSILFDTEQARKLFEEAGVFFKDQIKKDFDQLIEFNKSITEERRSYLEEDLKEINDELDVIKAQIDNFAAERSKNLKFIKEVDVFEKYKSISKDLVRIKADIETLERQRDNLKRLQELRSELRNIKSHLSEVQEEIENNVDTINSAPNSRFSKVREHFSDIVEKVLSRKALLSVSVNQQGHIEFLAEILDDDGNSTSADLGHTYKKLLCVAFDLSILRVHLGGKFPRWLYHDGIFESLDNRKKENLLEVIQEYTGLGIQMIVTAIDSDLPKRNAQNSPVFEDTQIVLRLHDEDSSGRLFRMASW